MTAPTDEQKVAAVTRMLDASEAILNLIDASADASGALRGCAMFLRTQGQAEAAAATQEQAQRLEAAFIRAAIEMRDRGAIRVNSKPPGGPDAPSF